MKTAVIILNWNGKENTLACLESVAKLKTENDELTSIVVDNNSHDNSVAEVKRAYPEATILENKQNLGFAGGMNTGIRHALGQHADFILILNNDTIVDHSLLVELMREIELNPNVGIASPKIYFAKGFEYHKYRYRNKSSHQRSWE